MSMHSLVVVRYGGDSLSIAILQIVFVLIALVLRIEYPCITLFNHACSSLIYLSRRSLSGSHDQMA
jgi:hypothetical protein